jgi:CBS domain-containing protein
MKVQDVMTNDVFSCAPQENLATVAGIITQRDCGIVPVVDANNRVVGIITERDICIAASNRKVNFANIKAEEFCNEKIVSCRADEKIKDVLKKMRKNKIKRLPVISQDGYLIGIISITDVLLVTKKDKFLRKKVISTLTAISKPLPITLREI